MKNSTISGGYKNIANGDYSFAFGQDVTLETTDRYTAAFFNDDNPGVVKISNVLKLEPRTTEPSPPEDGMIYIFEHPITSVQSIECYINGGWVTIDYH